MLNGIDIALEIDIYDTITDKDEIFKLGLAKLKEKIEVNLLKDYTFFEIAKAYSKKEDSVLTSNSIDF